MPKLTNW